MKTHVKAQWWRRIGHFFMRLGLKKTYRINGKLYPIQDLKIDKNGDMTFTIDLS
ncbi:hypothetical protein LDC_0875 [sediment metagenome]|uniref:Uncharacterized protein n=1 Tax=sediment metagenome TaxID=749907 RepID=D9PH75_9ZZZZ